ncbi:helix-turn-helix domain-containing protein [Actinosynnema sp. NPDC050436]|uniref:helix-turn-helix domain-containing protein n=1 Tax=Actinosynnema sp. NPDC050436 TaxID=3155659 RepID=UPI0034047EA7
MTEFNSELRRRREARGMTLTSLAATVHVTKGYLSKVENGRSRVTPRIARLCDEALGAEGELVDLVPSASEKSARLSRQCGMPTPPLLFVGRTGELAAVVATLNPLSSGRSCVISGLAGAGKTALAIMAAQAVAADFPRWRLHVDLHGHTPGAQPATPGEAAYRLLRQLEMPPDQIPADEEDRTTMLRAVLRSRRVLVLLDNVVTAEQVRPLLVDSPGCRFIVTSRNRLAALDEAHHQPLGMLSMPAAAELFRTVAGEMVNDGDAVVDIVRRCGMLPLAVRVAAARCVTGNWTTTRYLDRLKRESTVLAALNDGGRDVAAAFRVSFWELAPEQRRALALLAVHPAGTITTEAAEALAGVGTGGLDDVLDRLHDAHLVTRLADGNLTVHDLVRDFAVHHALPEIAETDRRTAVLRLVAHALGLAVAADEMIEPYRFRPQIDVPASDHLPFADADQALAWLRASWEALTDITHMADGDRRCWQLALVLRPFFFRERLFEPWTATHQTALRTAHALDDHLARGMVLNSLGMAHVERGALPEALDCHTEARAAYKNAGNHWGELDAFSSAAWVRLYQGAPDDTLRDLTTALDGYRRSERTRNVVITLRGLALASAAIDDHDAALEFACEAIDLAQLPVEVAMGLNCLAWVCFRAGRVDGAGLLYQKAARQAELADIPYERTRALVGLGNTAAHRGLAAEAAELWNQADGSRVSVNALVVGEGEARSRLEPLIEAKVPVAMHG